MNHTNFTKILFLIVLFLNFNSFSMFTPAGPLFKKFSKYQFKNSHNQAGLTNKFNDSHNQKTFRQLNSEPFKQEDSKTIPDSELENLKNRETVKVSRFFEKFIWKSGKSSAIENWEKSLVEAKDTELDPEAALKLLKYLKNDSCSQNFNKIRTFLWDIEKKELIKMEQFNKLSPRLQAKVLSKLGQNYYKCSDEDFEKVIINSKILRFDTIAGAGAVIVVGTSIIYVIKNITDILFI